MPSIRKSPWAKLITRIEPKMMPSPMHISAEALPTRMPAARAWRKSTSEKGMADDRRSAPPMSSVFLPPAFLGKQRGADGADDRVRRVGGNGVGSGGFGDLAVALAIGQRRGNAVGPLRRGRQPAVDPVLNRGAQGKGRRGNGRGAGDRRLEIFQLRLAVGEGVVLQRHEVQLGLAEQPLQVEKILQRVALDAAGELREHR